MYQWFSGKNVLSSKEEQGVGAIWRSIDPPISPKLWGLEVRERSELDCVECSLMKLRFMCKRAAGAMAA
jgi:hypothetical protein